MKLFVVENQNQSKKPVFFRYKMDARSWSQFVHPVPFDIKDFNDGIENYSNGMVLITEDGFQIIWCSKCDILRPSFTVKSSRKRETGNLPSLDTIKFQQCFQIELIYESRRIPIYMHTHLVGKDFSILVLWPIVYGAS